MEENSPIFTIETAALSDLRQLSEMDRICFPLDAWPLLERIGSLILPATIHLKAVQTGKMIGFVGGDIHRQDQTGWISTISVLPEHRRLGIASALLDACEKEMGMPRVKLAVRKSNLAAQMLYLKHGYQKVDTWPQYYQGGEDAIVMQKEITTT